MDTLLPRREARPLYPENQAFVVQFQSGSDAAACAGRVEHIASGRALRFSTATELLEFVQAILAALD